MKNRARSGPYIVLSIIALVFIIAILVGWNLIFPFYFMADFEADDPTSSKVLLWLLMAFGDIFLITVLTAVLVTMFAVIRRSKHIQRQTTFLDTISHELKTPLTSLRLCLDTLRTHQLEANKQQEFLGRMDSELSRLQRCIEQVLEANRLEHGERILTCVDTAMHSIAEHCCSRIRERYDLDQQALSMEGFSPDTVHRIDALALETILLNLLDNAVKYSPDEKHIVLRYSCDQMIPIISISDRGLGIDNKDIKKLFKRFSRLHNKHSNASIPGTGLGLALVENLATRMDMKVAVDSDGIGSGSCFTLTLAHTQGTP